jgi:hypothetical protein
MFIGLGGRDKLQNNRSLHKQIRKMAYQHLRAYLKAAYQLRSEFHLLLHDIVHIVFMRNFKNFKKATTHLISYKVKAT